MGTLSVCMLPHRAVKCWRKALIQFPLVELEKKKSDDLRRGNERSPWMFWLLISPVTGQVLLWRRCKEQCCPRSCRRAATPVTLTALPLQLKRSQYVYLFRNRCKRRRLAHISSRWCICLFSFLCVFPHVLGITLQTFEYSLWVFKCSCRAGLGRECQYRSL